MKENKRVLNNEIIKTCYREETTKSKTLLQNYVISHLEKLDFENIPLREIKDPIIFNHSKDVDMFQNLLYYFSQRRCLFLFISMLKSDEHSDQVLEIISKSLPSMNKNVISEQMSAFLFTILEHESDAKEFLAAEEFSDAFFSTYLTELEKNDRGTLHVNFTRSSLKFHIDSIFERKLPGKEIRTLKKLKMYDRGRLCLTLENPDEEKRFTFSPEMYFTLIVDSVEGNAYKLSLDIASDVIINLELLLDGEHIDRSAVKLSDVLKVPYSFDKVILNQETLYDFLEKYFKANSSVLQHTTQEEECLPIKTMEDLTLWNPSSPKHNTPPLAKRKDNGNTTQTLVCHDMKGGYLEDRFIHGTKMDDPYFFVHWTAVDTFVYFSHQFVTIPPCSWISAAHKNGVKILGTVITEWEEGGFICNEFLSNESTAYAFCVKLVSISKYYNFDGWLINIESPLKPSQIPLMTKLLKTLTEMMHAHIPGSLVLWYDSIIKNGELDWQSALTDVNRVFFDNCDGIFLNYVWKDKELQVSVENSGPRRKDVFVGVDMFGRGCLGGGGFHTDTAVKKAKEYDLSVAIFAPGWIYECLEVSDFIENQFKFWNSLHELIPPRSIAELPYCSSFCPGFGNKMFRKGQVISSESWFNLNLQQPQPVYSVNSEAKTMSLYTEDAYSGGGCLLLKGKMQDKETSLRFKILDTSFAFEDPCVISYTFKPLVAEVEFYVEFEIVFDTQIYHLRLVGSESETETKGDAPVKFLKPASSEEICVTDDKNPEKKSDSEGKWIKRKYILSPYFLVDDVVRKISAILSSDQKQSDGELSVLFGEICIVPNQQKYGFKYKDLVINVDVENSEIVDVICNLEWDSNSSVFCYDLYLHQEDDKSFLGSTSQLFYKLKLKIPLLDEIQVSLCPTGSDGESFITSTLKIPIKLE